MGKLKSLILLVLFVLVGSSNPSGQVATTYAFDFPSADTQTLLRFEYRVNSSPYVSIGVPAVVNDSLTAPGMDSRQFVISFSNAGTYVVAVRAVFTDGSVSSDSNDVSYRLIGSPSNLRIKK